jgi:hypothetical protein
MKVVMKMLVKMLMDLVMKMRMPVTYLPRIKLSNMQWGICDRAQQIEDQIMPAEADGRRIEADSQHPHEDHRPAEADERGIEADSQYFHCSA